MSLRERKKLATRDALISAARKLFVEKGYESTTLEEICEQVPIHVTTFFSYFDSKEELAFARTIESLDTFCRQIGDRPPGVDVMTAWWDFYYSFGLRDRKEESTLMLRMEEVPALRNRYAQILSRYEDELAQALAKEAGREPETDLYSRMFASTLLGTIVTGAHWHRTVHGRGALPNNTDALTKLILSRFPSRADFERLEHETMASASPKAKAARRIRRDPSG